VEQFNVRSIDRDGWSVVAIAGDLDVYTAPRLREVLVEKIDNGGSRIALDLSEVRFLDSTGLAVMVGGLKRAKERSGELVLFGANDQIRRILNITDLIKILPLHDTVDEVVSSNQTE
jgi:anti-sigma B factor antagonist